MEVTSPTLATRGPATASASEAWGVRMDAVVVARHTYCGRIGRFRYNGWISYQVFAVGFVVMCFVFPVYVFSSVVRATVGAVHRSRVVFRREAVGV